MWRYPSRSGEREANDYVQCHDCASDGPYGYTDVEAADKWNRRAQPPTEPQHSTPRERDRNRLQRENDELRNELKAEIAAAGKSLPNDNGVYSIQTYDELRDCATAIIAAREATIRELEAKVAEFKKDNNILVRLLNDIVVGGGAKTLDEIDAARAADYVMVPREPTDEMWLAFFSCNASRMDAPMDEFHSWHGDFGNFAASYNAMLQAATGTKR